MPTLTSGGASDDDGNPPFFQPTKDDLTWLLVQVMVILAVASIATRLFAYFQLPSAVAQIMTGIILGPTVLGYIPDFSENLYPEGELGALDTIAKFGLIWFMFLIGLEVNKDMLRSQLRHCLIISLSGVLFPLGIGAGVAQYLIHNGYVESGVNPVYFTLFIAVAMAITAFPVLARIISEHGLLDTTLGMLVLGSAAIDDLIGWVILAMNTALVRAGTGINGLYVCLVMFGFILFEIYAVAPLLAFACERFREPATVLSSSMFLVIVLLLLSSAWFTEAIGVEGIFGAFIFGCSVPRANNINSIISHKFEEFVVAVFLPMYFALSGLKTQLALISSPLDWGSCVLITILAFVGKILPGYVAGRYCGRSPREALVVGFLRNAKGLVEIVVLNLGLSLGVLTKKVFGMFVIMAILTTLSAVPLMQLVHPSRAIIAEDCRLRGGGTGAGIHDASPTEQLQAGMASLNRLQARGEESVPLLSQTPAALPAPTHTHSSV